MIFRECEQEQAQSLHAKSSPPSPLLPRKLKNVFIEYQLNAKCYGEHRRIRPSHSYTGSECGITPKTLSRGVGDSLGLM